MSLPPRRRWMPRMCRGRARPPAPLLLAALLVASCGDEDRTPIHFTPAVDRTSVASDDPAPPLQPMTPPAALAPVDSGAANSTILDLRGSPDGFRGQVVVRTKGAGSSITARLEGGVAGFTYGGEVRQGGCEAPGGRVAGLNPVSVDSAGSGGSYSDIPLGRELLRAAPYAITFGAEGAGRLCGSIRLVADSV